MYKAMTIGLFWLTALSTLPFWAFLPASAIPLPFATPQFETLTYGQTVAGSLTKADAKRQTGSFTDVYFFQGGLGDQVTLDLKSPNFDTYLILTSPSGKFADNDDANGSKSHSQIFISLPETGIYQILVTSYKAGQQGDYNLVLNGQPYVAPILAATTKSLRNGGRVFGLFVGVGDYNGRAPTLSYTADDATIVQNAMLYGLGMQPSDGIVLTDKNATTTQFQRAMYQLSQEVTPNDVFIFFFSGHGNRVRREVFQSSDPDGFDETMELYDGAVLDDELDVLLGMVRAKTQIIVMDACYSGGFAKDVISKPNRMGLFSSEEDIESNVASQFKAGGYLSYLFAEGVQNALADQNRDGTITALELSQYVQIRFREVVQQTINREGERAQNLSFQRLVVDRGGILPQHVLFFR